MQGKPLYWIEYGIGGGKDQNGQVKATTAAEAAQNPYFGIFGSYSRATDPWVLYDLSIPSPVRDYLRYFYNQSFQYAQQTGVSSLLPLFLFLDPGSSVCHERAFAAGRMAYA